MGTMRDRQIDGALQTLGLARRAGVVVIGQDRVLDRLRRGERFFIITTDDCAASVLSKVARYAESGSVRLWEIDGVTREELGQAMGVRSAQIAALPVESGFADRLTKLLNLGKQGGV